MQVDMREQLNNNPMVQMGVIAVLLLGAAIFLLTSMGGGEEEAESASSPVTATESVEPTEAAPSPGEAAPATATGGLSTLADRPLPNPVMAAWNANRTVVLLIVNDGGIDDGLVKLAGARLDGMPGVSTFVVPAGQIARYSAITQSVGVDRVPALVVLGPKRLNQSVPTASVSYGFQDGDSIAQAVIDAGYKGPTLEYHP
ncbi:MAG TPA: hypothetical protein VN179_04590 [Solirubrobacterales bacterium]|nr:hypothetical protein [Solirubrobacterales bacterium]